VPAEAKDRFPVPILYEDGDVWVFNKPAGLAVHGGAAVKRSLDGLLAQYFSPRPFLVHRLDKDTSGALLAAKHKDAAVCFSKIIERRQIQKVYRAVCKNAPGLHDDGVIGGAIGVQGRMKPAQTRYRKIGEADGLAVLRIELLTGRMHQIRRHLAAIGAPVIGDDKYGDFALNKLLRKQWKLNRLLLHAQVLVFPAKTGRITVEAPLPDYFPVM
jgi:23S rRNA pseudouridine955/2504/2580 synthase